MTLAICPRCGAEKFGAFVPCEDCGYEPDDARAKAEAIFFSDHCLDPESMKAVAAQLARGGTVKIPDEQFDRAAAFVAEAEGNLDEALAADRDQGAPADPTPRRPWPILVGLLVLAGLVWLVVRSCDSGA